MYSKLLLRSFTDICDSYTITIGLKLDKIRKNPAQFLSLTGFSSEEFDQLA